ncbi:Trehalose synthase/amylase TreS [Capillimicrobium parvum]|uniref:Alpha-amylase n=1 Tax=Capillimicrobium parvum TaxID=2884022 RepID=A0A9E6Y2X3_9ACTN|nr:Trehalose synthase/amylase TreS [Capillimicrobium parvum]
MRGKVTSDLWWKNAVVYCLDVETFLDSDGDGCGDLVGLTNRIDYLAGLGISCLWLMPFYPSKQRDDGYDITDFYGIDGRLGTPGDFAELIRTANDRGIRVVADLVMNHSSKDHPWFQQGRDRGSPFHDFYVWADEKPPEKPGDVVFPDRENSNWAWDPKARQWYLHRFYSHQPDLNVANPQVRDEIAQVVGYWLAQGLAGFRVDAVPFMLEPMGMPKGALHDPHELMRDLRRYMGRRRGDAILMGEVNLAPDQQRAFFGDEDGDELHMVLSFTINQAMYLALARGDATPLRAALEALPEIPADSQWANFVRNHDELTLDKLTDDERAEVFDAFGPDPDVQLYGRGLRKRLPTMVGGDERRIRMMYSLAFALPGTPVLFYGEEIGMAENLDIPGRYSVRAPMQWSAERHGGFSTVDDAARLCRPVVDADGWTPERVNVAAQRREHDSLLTWMERLIRRRRECPELGWGRCTPLDSGHPAVFAHRADWEDGTVVALHSFADQRVEARVELERGIEEMVDLLGHEHVVPGDGAVTVPLDPFGYRWFRVRRDGQRVAP